MNAAITEAIHRLDTMEREVTDWESNFLESVKRKGCHSPKQQAVLARMVDTYLEDGHLSAEILGQQTLYHA
jgi:hypothetical protein